MVVAQKLKESEITEQDSLLLTRNLLRIAIFNISYIRGLFPEKYFNDKSVPALEMKIKKLMPMDADSRRLIDWMEKGVYDALQKKYLKTLLFCICETVDGPMLEEYAFSFSYSNSDGQEVSMNINRIGSNKKGGAFNSNKEITPNQMRSSACKMVRTLIQLMRTLDKMPEERTILMKLLYYDHVTPMDYEPPFFRGCTEQEAHKPWIRNPLKLQIGNVNSKHFVLALKVKSVLDPCEDENDDNQDDAVSLGGDSIQRDEFSGSDNEASHSDDEQYIVAPRDKQQVHEDGGMADSDDTQDPVEDELAYGRVKDWICSHHLETVELTDVLSNFPDISVVLIEEIMDKLEKEGILSRAGTNSYIINKQKKSDHEFVAVKKETNGQPDGRKSPQGGGEDTMYMKALYYALPLNYISVAKLHSMLREVTRSTVSKLIDKMTNDGFVEAKSNKRLGKRVIHSDHTEKKLQEVKKTLDFDAMNMDVTEPPHMSQHPDFENMGYYGRDMSTCGILHSIGSDLTRSRGRAEAHQNGSMRRDQTLSGAMDHDKTPTSRVEPIVSLESHAPGQEAGTRAARNGNQSDEFNTICSKSSQNKRNMKSSTVKEPILQYVKRQKVQAV